MLSARTKRRLKRTRAWGYPRIKPYAAYCIDRAGNATSIEAHEIMIVLSPGIEMELNLAPHPGFKGGVDISTFDGVLAIHPSAANVVRVSVPVRSKTKRKRVRTRNT